VLTRNLEIILLKSWDGPILGRELKLAILCGKSNNNVFCPRKPRYLEFVNEVIILGSEYSSRGLVLREQDWCFVEFDPVSVVCLLHSMVADRIDRVGGPENSDEVSPDQVVIFDSWILRQDRDYVWELSTPSRTPPECFFRWLIGSVSL
jgi:hypothetical protein